jgi:hypothetical protein
VPRYLCVSCKTCAFPAKACIDCVVYYACLRRNKKPIDPVCPPHTAVVAAGKVLLTLEGECRAVCVFPARSARFLQGLWHGWMVCYVWLVVSKSSDGSLCCCCCSWLLLLLLAGAPTSPSPAASPST